MSSKSLQKSRFCHVWHAVLCCSYHVDVRTLDVMLHLPKKPTGIDWRIASSRSDVSRLTGSRLTEFIALSIDRRLETTNTRYNT